MLKSNIKQIDYGSLVDVLAKLVLTAKGGGFDISCGPLKNLDMYDDFSVVCFSKAVRNMCVFSRSLKQILVLVQEDEPRILRTSSKNATFENIRPVFLEDGYDNLSLYHGHKAYQFNCPKRCTL